MKVLNCPFWAEAVEGLKAELAQDHAASNKEEEAPVQPEIKRLTQV